jgi:precorrin-6B methylase 1
MVVGSGIQLGRHMSSRTVDEIRVAGLVFGLVDPATYAWLSELRPDIVDLRVCYAADRDRRESYAEMVGLIANAVLAGQRVCAVFYGHPGVYAQVPHQAIARVRVAGLPARMEPAISAEDCLYADLGMDPGRYGVQSFEATRFMVRDYAVEPSALLLLWQVAVAGRLDCTGFEACPKRLSLLVEKLRRWYPVDTPVILYEAARLAIETCRADRIPLHELPNARIEEHTTLVVPPVIEAPQDPGMLKRLSAL